MIRTNACCSAAIAFSLLLGTCLAACSAEEVMPLRTRVALAESLLPGAARNEATIVVRDPAGEAVTREGEGFVCVVDSSYDDRLGINCHHRSLDAQLAIERELGQTGLRGAEFRQALCERVAAAGIRVPDGAMEISTSVRIEPDGTLQPEMTVYYLLYLPHQTLAGTGISDVDPGDASPWLHMAGTCQAHVMWHEKRPLPTGFGGG